MKIEFKCPKCGTTPDGCEDNARDKCQSRRRESACLGFICECNDGDGEDHGETFTDPCLEANCYHCGWGGQFPVKPKGLQKWEQQALAAGWTPPEARAKELTEAPKKKTKD